LEKLRWLLSVFGNLNAERSLSHLINRPVYYREVPALVLEYTPQSGSVLLAAEQGHEFPPIRRDLPPTKAAKVDLLSELIIGITTETRTFSGKSLGSSFIYIYLKSRCDYSEYS